MSLQNSYQRAVQDRDEAQAGNRENQRTIIKLQSALQERRKLQWVGLLVVALVAFVLGYAWLPAGRQDPGQEWDLLVNEILSKRTTSPHGSTTFKTAVALDGFEQINEALSSQRIKDLAMVVGDDYATDIALSNTLGRAAEFASRIVHSIGSNCAKWDDIWILVEHNVQELHNGRLDRHKAAALVRKTTRQIRDEVAEIEDLVGDVMVIEILALKTSIPVMTLPRVDAIKCGWWCSLFGTGKAAKGQRHDAAIELRFELESLACKINVNLEVLKAYHDELASLNDNLQGKHDAGAYAIDKTTLRTRTDEHARQLARKRLADILHDVEFTMINRQIIQTAVGFSIYDSCRPSLLQHHFDSMDRDGA